MLCRDDHKVFGIIPIHRTHETDGRLHHELEDHLQDAVVLNHSPSRQTAALASLALAVGLDANLFPRSDHRAVRRRMAEVAGSAPSASGSPTPSTARSTPATRPLASPRPVSSPKFPLLKGA